MTSIRTLLVLNILFRYSKYVLLLSSLFSVITHNVLYILKIIKHYYLFFI